MVDIYIDPDIPYQTQRQQQHFVLEDQSNIHSRIKASNLDDCCIAEKVIPHILKMHKDKNTVITRGKALLWVYFDTKAQEMIPL